MRSLHKHVVTCFVHFRGKKDYLLKECMFWSRTALSVRQKRHLLMVTKRILKKNVNSIFKAGVHAAESSVDIVEVTELWRKLHNEKFCNINIIQAVKN